jgi:hypothetical protein
MNDLAVAIVSSLCTAEGAGLTDSGFVHSLMIR